LILSKIQSFNYEPSYNTKFFNWEQRKLTFSHISDLKSHIYFLDYFNVDLNLDITLIIDSKLDTDCFKALSLRNPRSFEIMKLGFNLVT